MKRKLTIRLFITLGLYALLGFVVITLIDHFSQNTSIYFIQWLSWRLDVIYVLYLIFGYIAIFLYYWHKPWAHLDEIVSATKTLFDSTEQTITLSEPMHETERYLNELRMTMLLNQQSAKEAEQKKNDLVMYLAHDIRTPLTTVIGYLSLLEEAPDMPTEQKTKYIDTALHKAERLEKLINELFEITRYNSQQQILHKDKVEINCLLAQVADEFYPLLSQKGNTIKLAIEEELFCLAEPEQLARAFSNLLKNAVGYSYSDTEILISGKKIGESILITFRNKGRTISSEELIYIFDKFHRLDEARSSDTGGSGLGLSIAKEIIRLHGGELTAQSNDETIIFTVSLPKA